MLGVTLILLMACTIATLNVNGLKKHQKREMVFEYLTRKKTAIVFLQETHSEPKDEMLWRKQWGGQITFSHGKSNSCGVAILISRKSGFNITNTQRDSNGRWVKGDIEMDGNIISLISLYAPNNATIRKQFFVEFGNKLSNIITDYNCIMSGDFNCHLDSTTNYDQSKNYLSNIIQENNLIDTWNCVESKPVYTFFHKILKRPSRIDYVFISKSLEHQLKTINVDSSGLSDHSTVIVRLVNQSVLTGRSRWFCNNDLLKDDQCKIRVKWLWNYWKTQKNNYDSFFIWWDIGKNRLKELRL